MALGRTVGKNCAAGRTNIAGYKSDFFLADRTKQFSSLRIQNFSAAQTPGRENNIVDII
jgi:hypothetical protein